MMKVNDGSVALQLVKYWSPHSVQAVGNRCKTLRQHLDNEHVYQNFHQELAHLSICADGVKNHAGNAYGGNTSTASGG